MASKELTLSQLKKKLDAVFSVFIRMRDKGQCFTCPTKKPWKQMQNGHYVSRQYLSVRWDIRNCHTQCVSCNIFKHGNMTAYAVKMVKLFGPSILQELEKEKWRITKLYKPDYLELIEYWTEEVAKLDKKKPRK